MVKLFKDFPIYTTILKKCNIQEKNAYLYFFSTPMKLFIYDSFVKFWTKYAVNCKEVVVKKSTVMFGSNAVPIFKDVVTLNITECFIKN